MEEIVRYSYRLRPGRTAERALSDEWNRCRFIWNEAVHQQKTGQNPTYKTLQRMLTEARANVAWLRDGSSVAQQQTIRGYASALSQSFTIKGRGKPLAKKKRQARPTLEYTVRGFSIRDRRLRLAGGISIPVVWSRELPAEPTSVRVFQDSLGDWYASFVVRRDVGHAPDADGEIGIDWGITTTATTTDPAYDLPNLGLRKRSAAELAKAQRKMSRRQRPRGQAQSKGYKRARREAGVIRKKAARRNQHEGRVWAKRVVDNHAVIAVEDFRPSFLAKSTLSRQVADAAIGAAKRELIYRGMRAGRKVVLVPPAYTTMTCGSCFARAKQRLSLGERVFRCEHCGHVADRDRNAARVILATVEPDRVGADDVRHCLPPSGELGCAI